MRDNINNESNYSIMSFYVFSAFTKTYRNWPFEDLKDVW